MGTIKLNDILMLDDLENTKIRFLLPSGERWNPIEHFRHGNMESLLGGQYWNYAKNKTFKDGQKTVGFIRIRDNLWLLFHVGIITKDLNKFNGVGYEYKILDAYEKYFGRLIIKFENKSQNLVRNATSTIDDCEVIQILPDVYNNDIFPGYDNINISWEELSQIITNEKESWKTALENQKGIYLITDVSNGKMYVGSAYGEYMIYGRWKSYIKTGHGGNINLKKLDFEYIKNNFRFSILDIYKSTTDDNIIIERESWWKSVLQTRKYGYNEN